MVPLERFSSPVAADALSESDRTGWSERVAAMFDQFAGTFTQFVSPLATDIANASAAEVRWPAIPATLIRETSSLAERWAKADSARGVQDEYCEWAVTRDEDGRVKRVTFTTETPEYYRQLFETNPDLLVALYEEFVGTKVELGDLTTTAGYQPGNRFNRSTSGTIAHLVQTNNTLEAAVRLAAEATVLRQDGGIPVTNQQELVICGGLGNPFRNSDPQIAAAINQLAASGVELSLADPPGLFIDRLITAGLRTPDETDAAEFWKVERGVAGHAVRASFEVPDDAGYSVSEITADGRPIAFGAQLAERVQVKLAALSIPADHAPDREPCVA